jgi:hypothetical protein
VKLGDLAGLGPSSSSLNQVAWTQSPKNISALELGVSEQAVISLANYPLHAQTSMCVQPSNLSQQRYEKNIMN